MSVLMFLTSLQPLTDVFSVVRSECVAQLALVAAVGGRVRAGALDGAAAASSSGRSALDGPLRARDLRAPAASPPSRSFFCFLLSAFYLYYYY